MSTLDKCVVTCLLTFVFAVLGIAWPVEELAERRGENIGTARADDEWRRKCIEAGVGEYQIADPKTGASEFKLVTPKAAR